jgi:HEAT repeat protein
VVVDPVADAMARLQSHHGNSRRDGAVTLGRLRDPRAIPALVDRLKNDKDKEVRVASATALGEIGDPSAASYLERATVYDKKKEVRDAASAALSRMPRTLPPGNPPVESSAPAMIAPAPAPTSVPAIEPQENVPPPPMPDPPAPGFRDRP